VKRINPETGRPFAHGDIRADGCMFQGYNKNKIKKDGTYQEVWINAGTLERKKEYDKERCQKISKANREWMNDLKVNAGCACCGYNEYPEGLDFDHLKDKKFNVGRGGTLSRKRLEQEIVKCQVLCGTCHHIKTRNPSLFADLIKKRGTNPLSCSTKEI
jgi:hypothetical protein